MKKIPIGISSCLLGQQARFDGGHKRDAYIVGTLSGYFEFHPFCPEVAIGLGIPRPTIHLVKIDTAIRCVCIKDPELDVTDRLRDYAEQQKECHAGLCGYILKKDSPSCGMGQLLADLIKDNLLQVAEHYILQLMNTLKTVVSRSNHVEESYYMSPYPQELRLINQL